MQKFFIDEAGYTGHDLWNMQQPFQGASAIRIDETSARALAKEYFPLTQSQELKHQKLSRRRRNWQALLELQARLLIEHQCYTYVCNKRYLLTLMFLDYCVEPAFHDRGIDFFVDGHNYDLASVIYHAAPTLWGEHELSDLLYLFQRALRTKSALVIEALIQKSITLCGREFSEYLLPIANRDKACLNEILTSSLDTEKFPLRLKGVSQADSKNCIGIQLADVLVGAITQHSAALSGLIEKNEYNCNIGALYPDTSLIFMMPNLNFAESREFRRGTKAAEMIEFFSKTFG